MSELTTEELDALTAFARAHGRKWKSRLVFDYWYNARLWEDHTGSSRPGSILHGLRNRLGPSWLQTFKLPKGTA